MPILSRNVDKKSIETVFSIAICRHTGDKWESKTLFLSVFDPRSSIIDNVFNHRLRDVQIFDKEYELRGKRTWIRSLKMFLNHNH